MPVFITTPSLREMYRQSVQSIRAKHPYCFIPVLNRVDAASQDLEYPLSSPRDIIPLRGKQPQSVASAWNMGILKGRECGCDYVVVLNQDVVLKSSAIDVLVEYAETYPDYALWAMSSCSELGTLEEAQSAQNSSHENLLSAFMVRGTFFDVVGTFDENYVPAYWEDKDMIARLVLAGRKMGACPSALYFHHGSATIRNDPVVAQENKTTFWTNARYFIQKWGSIALPDHSLMLRQYYAHPYNEKDKPLSYWRKGADGGSDGQVGASEESSGSQFRQS